MGLTKGFLIVGYRTLINWLSLFVFSVHQISKRQAIESESDISGHILPVFSPRFYRLLEDLFGLGILLLIQVNITQTVDAFYYQLGVYSLGV